MQKSLGLGGLPAHQTCRPDCRWKSRKDESTGSDSELSYQGAAFIGCLNYFRFCLQHTGAGVRRLFFSLVCDGSLRQKRRTSTRGRARLGVCNGQGGLARLARASEAGRWRRAGDAVVRKRWNTDHRSQDKRFYQPGTHLQANLLIGLVAFALSCGNMGMRLPTGPQTPSALYNWIQ